MGAPDEARKTCLLEFFTDHFVSMAKESNRKRSYGQALMYVMQAENLLQLLGDDNSRYAQINTKFSPNRNTKCKNEEIKKVFIDS